MRSTTVQGLAAALLCGVLPLAVAAQNDNPTKTKQTPTAVEKIRQELGKKVTLDFTSQNFHDGIDHLRQKTKLNITLDRSAAMMLGLNLGFDNQATPVHLKVENGPVRIALQRMLSPYGLTYVILADSVLITSERMAYARQVHQGVSVHVEDKPLDAALRALARETGVELLIDPALGTLPEKKTVTLKLEDTTLETAVRLLTEMAGVKVVQVGHVMFVTDSKKAADIRQENLERRNNNPQGIFPQVIGGGFGGFGGIGGGGAVPVPPPVQNPPAIKKALPPPNNNPS